MWFKWDKTLQTLSWILPWAHFQMSYMKNKQLFFHLYLEKYHIYYKSALLIKSSQLALPSRNYMLHVYAKTKSNCPVFPQSPSLDEWLLFHWVCQWLCSVQWKQLMVESPGGMFGLNLCEVSPSCRCHSKHYTLRQSLAHVWNFTREQEASSHAAIAALVGLKHLDHNYIYSSYINSWRRIVKE